MIDTDQQICTIYENIDDADQQQNSQQPIEYQYHAEMSLVDQHFPTIVLILD
jgi:hypothetical protein